MVSYPRKEASVRDITTPSADAVIPSIEKDTFQIVIPLTRLPPVDVSSPTVNTSKVYDCDVCGTQYKTLRGLEKVSHVPSEEALDDLAHD